MAFKDALEEATTAHHGRGRKCRVCHLLTVLPDSEAEALRAFFDPALNLGPKPIADIMADEGHGDLYHSVKGHMYVCLARS